MEKYVTFVEKRFIQKLNKDKRQCKVRNHCHYASRYRGAAHSICNLKYNVPNETTVVFHNDSNYNYYLIIKGLVKKIKGQFSCLGKNTEKYKPFSITIEKEVTKIDEDSHKNFVPLSYKIKFIDSVRFKMSSLSNLANSLTEGIYKIKCEDCNCFLEYESFKNNLIKYECLSWNKNYSNKIDKVLKKRFWNTFKFSNNDSNKSILLLRKGV